MKEYTKNYRLKEYRKKHKLTQKDLAKLVDVSPDYISQIERGRIPGMVTAIKLAKLFNTTLEDLFLNQESTARKAEWIIYMIFFIAI